MKSCVPGGSGEPGCGGDEVAVDHEPYDPYSSYGDGCAGGGEDGSGVGGEGEGGTPDGSGGGDEACGGGPLYYDYLCIDVWNPETGEWEEFWCGTAAICL